MKLGYQTNTWGGVVGHPAGVTSVKDLYYLANGSTEQALRDIAAAGYKGIELFDGNLMQYENRPDEFRQLLKSLDLAVVGVYTGANFIFKDILEEEFDKIEKVAKLAAEFGTEHLVFGGGAVRAGGIQESDYEQLAQSLERGAKIAEKIRIGAKLPPAFRHMCAGTGSARQNYGADFDCIMPGYGPYRSGWRRSRSRD